ncbi:MAG: hypothetical protein ABI670_10960 [Chloroflexota bacterium]
MDANRFGIPPADAADSGVDTEGGVVSALFADSRSARAAIAELREIGVSPDSISLISRNEAQDTEPDLAGTAGISREDVEGEDLTYRASEELPNDEDLPTTEAQMTGNNMPVVLAYEVPPDEPLGGSNQLGLTRDADLVRRNDADSNADIDIYTDFPDEPGGVNPDAPISGEMSATEQAPVELGEQRVGSAVVGAGVGSVAGLLAGIAALAIPGVGPLIAAGPIAAALGGMLAGGAAGGIIGALATVGVPEEFARTYAASIQEGQILVSVRTSALGQDAVERVLVANGGQEVHS